MTITDNHIIAEVSPFKPDTNSDFSSWVQTIRYVQDNEDTNVGIILPKDQLSDNLMADLRDYAIVRGGDVVRVKSAETLSEIVFPNIGLFIEPIKD